MKRIPEPELMDGQEQAKAYALADFSGPNELFIHLFTDFITEPIKGDVLDLGCGPADICIRFVQVYPECRIYGVDGSKAMLDFARQSITAGNLEKRISIIEGLLPDVDLPNTQYSALISNSLLHHLPDPMTLWETIKKYAHDNTAILVMDLMRPQSAADAKKIVAHYAQDEPDILKEDFHNSLLAAYRIEEVETQLKQAGLDSLKVDKVSDRHLIIKGSLT